MGSNPTELPTRTYVPCLAKWPPLVQPAVLGFSIGLVSATTLMMDDDGAPVRLDVKSIIVRTISTDLLVGGACGMAIGEYLSKRLDLAVARWVARREGRERGVEYLPSPFTAGAIAPLGFWIGVAVLVMAGSFIENDKMRMVGVAGATSAALVVLGLLEAALLGAPKARSAVTVLVGGWLAVAVNIGCSKLASWFGFLG